MSYPSRPLASHHVRQSSAATGSLASNPAGQSPVLVARINEKKAELENLKQLRDLSGALAGQMQVLEEKLATLSDGTEAVATVLGNWHSVLQAISMASSKLTGEDTNIKLTRTVKIPKPKEAPENEEEQKPQEAEPELPQTLVRIPTEHAPMLQPQQNSGDGNKPGED